MRLRPHGRALVGPAVALVVAMGAVGFLAGLVPEGPWQGATRLGVAAAGALLVLRLAVVPWARWVATALVLTDRRVRLRTGVCRSTTRDVPLGRIADVGVQRTMLQRLLGSGTLLLNTAGHGVPVAVADVPRVQQVADELNALLDDLDRDHEHAGRVASG